MRAERLLGHHHHADPAANRVAQRPHGGVRDGAHMPLCEHALGQERVLPAGREHRDVIEPIDRAGRRAFRLLRRERRALDHERPTSEPSLCDAMSGDRSPS